ncbi:MAG: hypothetical protein R3266_02570 [Gemmatimonadota bacterium]|nr:hypothetical protein [Gemmatimonadota bacterium]
MKKGLRTMWIPLVAATFAWSACSDDDPVGGGDVPPPDLSGTYTLVTFSSPLTGGVPLGPAQGVTGTFTLDQTNVDGDEATGTLSVTINVPDGMGGTNQIVDQGTFTIRSDGSWEQSGQLNQATGTYDLQGNVLTVVVTQPAAAVSTSVWQRQ